MLVLVRVELCAGRWLAENAATRTGKDELRRVQASRRVRVAAIGALAMLATLACAPGTESPPLVAGEIDLSSWSFESGGNVALAGDWRVCWGQLLGPLDRECPGGWSTVPVPGLWSEVSSASPFGGKGVATYRLVLVLPTNREALFLRAGAAMTAYRLWIDGVDRGGAGVVGPTPEKSSPLWRNRVFDLPAGSHRVELNVQVANFDFRGGGLRRPWLVGGSDQIQSFIGRGILRDSLLALVALLVGLAYGLQFVLRPSEPARGYFALFALVIGVRAIPSSISDFSQLLVPWASFEALIRSEYVLTALAIFAGGGFFRTKAPGVMPPRLCRIAEMTALAVAAIALVAPVPLVLATLPVIMALPPLVLATVVVSYGRAWRRGVKGVAPTLIASFAYGGVVVHDLVRTQTGHGAPLELFPYFFLVWLLSEAAGMLQAFFRSLSSVEELSNQLLESNFELQEDEAAVMRFVPFDVLRLLGRKSIRQIAPGDSLRARMTVLYLKVHVVADRSFDPASDEAFRVIHARLLRVDDALRHSGGVVSRQGVDALFALFPDRAEDAVLAAVALLRDAPRDTASDDPSVRVGIGIATGPLVIGTMGNDQQLSSGLIGRPVDVAQRLEALTGAYGVDLLVAASTRDEIGPDPGFSLRELDVVKLSDGQEPVTIVEVRGAHEGGAGGASGSSPRG
jgi:class 3 adenylate cyclase